MSDEQDTSEDEGRGAISVLTKKITRERFSTLLETMADTCSTREKIDQYLDNGTFPGTEDERTLIRLSIIAYCARTRLFGFSVRDISDLETFTYGPRDP